jgi:hypothetical protein
MPKLGLAVTDKMHDDLEREKVCRMLYTVPETVRIMLSEKLYLDKSSPIPKEKIADNLESLEHLINLNLDKPIMISRDLAEDLLQSTSSLHSLRESIKTLKEDVMRMRQDFP